MAVAGTDAAAVVLPHLARQLITPHAQRADVAAQAGDPGGHPPSCARSWPHVPGIRGPDRSRPCWPRPWTRTSRHRSPASLLRRPGTGNQEIRLLHKGRGASPTAATRGSSAPCSPPPSPHYAPTPSPGPTTNANETKANRLGPGRPRPSPPPHPDPARHDPRWSPLRPTTNHETTRRRLTHHIGAPPIKAAQTPSPTDLADPLPTPRGSGSTDHRLCVLHEGPTYPQYPQPSSSSTPPSCSASRRRRQTPQ